MYLHLCICIHWNESNDARSRTVTHVELHRVTHIELLTPKSVQMLHRRSCVWHDSIICVTWLIHICAMTHSYAWHDSFICLHVCDMTHSYVCHDSFICAPWFICVCAVTHSCVTWLFQMWNDSFMCDAYIRKMTHSYICRDSFICGTGLKKILRTPYVWHDAWDVSHDSFICVPWLIHMFVVTHSSVGYD